MADLIEPLAARRGDAPALVDEQGSRTFAELDDRTNRLVHALRSLGIQRGDTIAAMVGNRCEFFELFAAAAHGGWVVVPVNWHWVSDELAYVLANSGARVAVIEDRFAQTAQAAREQSSQVEQWVSVGAPVDGMIAFEELIAGANSAPPPDQHLGGPMFYTSGTTGFPKGVRSALVNPEMPASLLSLIASGFTSMLGLPPDGVTLLDGPAYHSAQWVFSTFSLMNGSTVVMRHRFDPAETLRAIDTHRVTNVHLVPTQFIRLLRLPEEVRASFDGSSLQLVHHGAAPCPPEIKRQMIDWWGPRIWEYYGGTEGGFLTMISSEEWLERPGSIGRPVDTAEIAVLDDDGNPVPVGEAGQVWFRSKMGTDFEYHGDPEKTRAAHREGGWGTLGDVGYFDADGYLYLSDRKIDMIISGGVNIYPAEIESVLVTDDRVADAAVFGIPDEEMGEQVKAVVELVPGVTPTEGLEAELIALCRSRLAGYKAPRSVDVIDALPRHPTGKLYKRLLRDPYWEGVDRSI
jgi:long-chain acyl-CoA synthetase